MGHDEIGGVFKVFTQFYGKSKNEQMHGQNYKYFKIFACTGKMHNRHFQLVFI
jgi:hypothetical protein